MSNTSIFETAAYILRTRGFKGFMYALSSRIHSLLGMRSTSFRAFEGLFREKKGIEIGGPSQVFSIKGIFPVYPIVEHLDNCNYSSTTVWEGKIKDGDTYHFDCHKFPGHQYIAEATAMVHLSSSSYDFVLASHILEHIANPIRALFEWLRLLKEHGLLVMLLPLKSGNFDHRRPVTSMEHLIADFTAEVTENDLTHMPEILELHDLERDPEVEDVASFKARSIFNYENRCFHHHVFDPQLAACLLDYTGMQIKAVETIQPTHILIVAQKMMADVTPDNLTFTGKSS